MHRHATLRFPWQVLLLFLAVLLAAQAVTEACPLCKEAVANDEAEDGSSAGPTRTARGYAWSIAVMLCMPFLMVGGVALLLVSAYRRNTAQPQATQSPSTNTPTHGHERNGHPS